MSAKSVMNKGYWTGNLARMIRDTKIGDMKYAITSNAGYSSFLEYGTRYMAPETFMFLFMKDTLEKSERTSRN